MTVSFLVAMWLSSAGIEALRTGVNLAYGTAGFCSARNSMLCGWTASMANEFVVIECAQETGQSRSSKRSGFLATKFDVCLPIGVTRGN